MRASWENFILKETLVVDFINKKRQQRCIYHSRYLVVVLGVVLAVVQAVVLGVVLVMVPKVPLSIIFVIREGMGLVGRDRNL